MDASQTHFSITYARRWQRAGIRWRRSVTAFLSLILCCESACSLPRVAHSPFVPPMAERFTEGPLHVYSSADLQRHEPLFRELAALRFDIARQLEIPVNETPVRVYVYETRTTFAEASRLNDTDFADRRAFFVEADGKLGIHVLWSENLAADLRHEVTHGYLHGVIPNLPLWLDEGLAEYFEAPPADQGRQRVHAELLSATTARNAWKPNLRKLAARQRASELTQLDYAEAWHWTYQLLETSPARRVALREFLNGLRRGDAVSDVTALESVLVE